MQSQYKNDYSCTRQIKSTHHKIYGCLPYSANRLYLDVQADSDVRFLSDKRICVALTRSTGTLRIFCPTDVLERWPLGVKILQHYEGEGRVCFRWISATKSARVFSNFKESKPWTTKTVIRYMTIKGKQIMQRNWEELQCECCSMESSSAHVHLSKTLQFQAMAAHFLFTDFCSGQAIHLIANDGKCIPWTHGCLSTLHEIVIVPQILGL